MTLRRRADSIATPRLLLWSSAMYPLDTNVVSELRRPRPHGAVLDWIGKAPAEQLFVSAVTVGEIQAGIEITREQDDAKAEELEVWLDKVLASYGVLPMDAPALPGVGTAHAQEVGHYRRRRDDRGDSHRTPADCGHSECE